MGVVIYMGEDKHVKEVRRNKESEKKARTKQEVPKHKAHGYIEKMKQNNQRKARSIFLCVPMKL
jgi:hypothetical protein